MILCAGCTEPGTQNIAILNAGIGGNHLFTTSGQSPIAVAQIGRDVLLQPGIRDVTIFEGVNAIDYMDPTTEAQDISTAR